MEKFSIWIAEILILNKASDKIQFILISNDPNFELFFSGSSFVTQEKIIGSYTEFS